MAKGGEILVPIEIWIMSIAGTAVILFIMAYRAQKVAGSALGGLNPPFSALKSIVRLLL